MEYADEEKGRCRSCGFLAKHSLFARSPRPRFHEIEAGERRSANHVSIFTYPATVGTRMLNVEAEVVCFVHEYDLMEELPNVSRGELKDATELQRAEVAVEVIAKDRHCQAWYPYTPGFGPSEHYEELKMQRLEQDRRTFEMQLAAMGERAQERSAAIAEENKNLIAGLKEIAEKNDRFSRRVTALVILLAVIQTIGTLLALSSVSWVQRLWRYVFG